MTLVRYKYHIYLLSFFRSFSVLFYEFTVNAKWYVGEVATLDGLLKVVITFD